MRSNEQLKKLAKEVYEGTIFLAHTEREIQTCFSIILIFAKEGMIPEDTVAFYEDMSKAGPRSINGLPFFTSCSFLSKDEMEIFVTYFEEYKELVKGWE